MLTFASPSARAIFPNWPGVLSTQTVICFAFAIRSSIEAARAAPHLGPVRLARRFERRNFPRMATIAEPASGCKVSSAGGGARVARPAHKVHVVVVGSTNFDLVVRADRLPKEGENVMATGLKFFPGGKGGNQAVAVRRLGAKATFIGCVGEDVFGEFLLRNLRTNGIESRWVKRTKSVS